MFMTSKGNFAVEWRPVGTVSDRPGPDCDWKRWHRVDAYFGERPSNELVFIRSLGEVERAFSLACETDEDLRKQVAEWPEFLKKSPGHLESLKQSRDEYCALRLTADTILLQATTGLVNELKHRLQLCFDVRLIGDIFTEWQEIKDSPAPLGTRRILMKWSIDNVAERTRQSELAELNTLAVETSCSAETLVKALADEAAIDPMPDRRVTKELKKAGYKITPSVTRRYLDLLKRHRPEMFPSTQKPSTVVPFRAPDRT
jgi:hypothetical protein